MTENELDSRLDHVANELLLHVRNDRRCNDVAYTITRLYREGYCGEWDALRCARHIVESLWGWIDFAGIGESDIVAAHPAESRERAARLLIDSGALDFD